MMTVTQTTRLLVWVIVGLIALAILLYLFGPAALRTDELIIIGLLIIGLIWFSSLAPPARPINQSEPWSGCPGQVALDQVALNTCLAKRLWLVAYHQTKRSPGRRPPRLPATGPSTLATVGCAQRRTAARLITVFSPKIQSSP